MRIVARGWLAAISLLVGAWLGEIALGNPARQATLAACTEHRDE